MKRDFLGDSCDAVKRLWQQVFAEWAPLYAEPRFIPCEVQDDFTRLTGIPFLTDRHPPGYSILNDPDTGIRLPDAKDQREGQRHIRVATIVDQLRNRGPRCVVTFDLSHDRRRELKHDSQRQVKLRCLAEEGIPAFYYVSHAPFLFAFPDSDSLRELQDRLLRAGIPADRIEATTGDS